MKIDPDLETVGAAGGSTKLKAALSGQTWLLSIANSVQDHPQNLACRFFELDYYEESLNDGDYVTSEDAETMTFTSSMRDLVLDENLTALQLRFRQCIRTGYEIPDCYNGCNSSCGCIICDPDDICDFWPFFAKVLQQLHGSHLVSIDDDQPVSHVQGKYHAFHAFRATVCFAHRAAWSCRLDFGKSQNCTQCHLFKRGRRRAADESARRVTVS